jgi:hypothetical protein
MTKNQLVAETKFTINSLIANNYLDKEDIEDLRILMFLLENEQFDKAKNFAISLDTIVREEIPNKAWNFLINGDSK